MKKNILILLILFLNITAQDQNKNILFIGNSYTFYNNMPGLVKELFEINDPDIKVNIEAFTANGATIESHYNNKKLDSMIKGKDWEIIILQEQSLRPIREKDLFLEFSKKFFNKYSSNSEIYIFQTWARKNKPAMHKELSASFMELKNKVGIQIIPVGEIWDQVFTENPKINLYSEDLSHPNINGSYLTALTFYRFLSNSLGRKKRKIADIERIKIGTPVKKYLNKKVQNY